MDSYKYDIKTNFWCKSLGFSIINMLFELCLFLLGYGVKAARFTFAVVHSFDHFFLLSLNLRFEERLERKKVNKTVLRWHPSIKGLFNSYCKSKHIPIVFHMFSITFNFPTQDNWTCDRRKVSDVPRLSISKKFT